MWAHATVVLLSAALRISTPRASLMRRALRTARVTFGGIPPPARETKRPLALLTKFAETAVRLRSVLHFRFHNDSFSSFCIDYTGCYAVPESKTGGQGTFRKYWVDEFGPVGNNSEAGVHDIMAEIYSRGPIACSINASNPDFEGTIFNTCVASSLFESFLFFRY
jgi:hypothetical protein